MADDNLSFRLVADSAPVPMWVTEPDGNRLFVNRAYAAFVGCSYDEALRFDWRTIIHPDDAATIVEQSMRGEASLKPFTLEGRYRRSDGQWRWISSISNPRWDAEGQHCGVIGVAHDITDAKTAELALREREAEFSAIVNQSAAGFAQTDLAGKFTLVSDHFCTICGWDRSHLMERTMLEITHPDDRAANLSLFETLIADGTPFTIEKRYQRPDGNFVWVSNSVSLIRREDGNAQSVLAVSLDITERRKSEIALKRASESMRLAVEGAGMATWELDLSTMEGPWSRNRFEILGYPPSANGRGSYDEWCARVHADDFQRASAAAQKCLTDGTPFEIEYRIVRADNNEERWLRSNGSLIRASAGQPARFVGISFDITRRKRGEAHQQLLIDELNHRVKNTLGIVQGIAQQSFNKGTSLQEITEAFEGRLAALSAVHNLLTTGLWQAISLTELIAASLKPLAREAQIYPQGPEVMLGTKTAVTMALALHELATNALKYGALSVASGAIWLNWTVSSSRELTLEWVEQGGPAVSPPNKRGFGIRMIEKGLAAEFRGNVDILFDPNGLICRLTAQLPESDD